MGCGDQLWASAATSSASQSTSTTWGLKSSANHSLSPRWRSCLYLYDFGDGWEHTLRIERITEPVRGIAYPHLREATGRCPPEDVGGPWGYQEFLEAIADPKHERHSEFVTWIGDNFDPTAVNAERHARDIAALAKRWSRSPTTRRKQST